MTISKRLRAISDFISDNSFILDIGCDHALLDIYCALNKKNVKAIASDINEGPLAMAKENVQKYLDKFYSKFSITPAISLFSTTSFCLSSAFLRSFIIVNNHQQVIKIRASNNAISLSSFVFL